MGSQGQTGSWSRMDTPHAPVFYLGLLPKGGPSPQENHCPADPCSLWKIGGLGRNPHPSLGFTPLSPFKVRCRHTSTLT
jgi:hypothetical protein